MMSPIAILANECSCNIGRTIPWLYMVFKLSVIGCKKFNIFGFSSPNHNPHRTVLVCRRAGLYSAYHRYVAMPFM